MKYRVSLWHRIQHRFGWWSGRVVSRTDERGRIMIGFRCNACERTMSEHDATVFIDRHIEQHAARITR